MSISDVQQPHRHTKFDRYPEVFQEVVRLTQGIERPRILSFGCSTGQEVATIAKYFPSAEITGIDVSREALGQAESEFGHVGRFLHSSELDSAEQFDVVFAMSVLCVYPASLRRGSLRSLYPFERFDATLMEIDRLVRPGGLLVMYNANYRFVDASIAPGYRIEKCDGITENGFVPRFSRKGVKLDGYTGVDVIYRKRREPIPELPDGSSEPYRRIFREVARLAGPPAGKRALVIGRTMDSDRRIVESELAGAEVVAIESVEDLGEEADFDLVFAMSMLCVYPQSHRRNGLRSLYPFAKFDEELSLLDARLRPGGLLAIYNANYRFIDASVSGRYRAEVVEGVDRVGTVPKFSRSSVKMRSPASEEVIYRKRPSIVGGHAPS